MDDVRGDFIGPPHGTTSAAVIANKNKTEKVDVIAFVSFSYTHRFFFSQHGKHPVKKHRSSVPRWYNS